MTKKSKQIVMFLFTEVECLFSSSDLLQEYNKKRKWYKFKLPMKKNKIDEICDILITKYGILKRCDDPQNENPYHLDRLYLLTEEVRNHGNRIELTKIWVFNYRFQCFSLPFYYHSCN